MRYGSGQWVSSAARAVPVDATVLGNGIGTLRQTYPSDTEIWRASRRDTPMNYTNIF